MHFVASVIGGGLAGGAGVQGVVDTLVNLPVALNLPDGTIYYVRQVNEIGQSGLAIVRAGFWAFPRSDATPTVSFVGMIGAGLGELPETYAVGAGVDLVVGDAVTADPMLTLLYPADVATFLDGEVTMGDHSGVWRMFIQVNCDLDVALWQGFLQLNTGSGWVDQPGEVFRRDALAAVAGQTLIGVELNVFLVNSAMWRFVIRHDAGGNRNITINTIAIAANVVNPST